MGVGFIRDKLEIKFLILYIAARVSEPLPLEGMQELTICESSLPYSVRLRTDRNIEEYNKELLRQAQVQGKAIPRENGTYTVELKLSDDVDSLMQLELMVATEEMAKDLAERFRKDPEHLYARVLEALYEEQK